MQGPVRALPSQLCGAAAVGGWPAFRRLREFTLQIMPSLVWGFGFVFFVFVFFSEDSEGNIHIAFIFNTFADAFENVYATEFANIL